MVIGPHDLQIAAVALRHGLILVTHNRREFERIPYAKRDIDLLVFVHDDLGREVCQLDGSRLFGDTVQAKGGNDRLGQRQTAVGIASSRADALPP